MSRSVVGESIPRSDAREKVLGRANYTATMRIPGMLYAAVLRSPVPHALIKRIDVSGATNHPGVVATLTRDDLHPGAGLVVRSHFGAVYKDQPIVATDRVRFVGDPVAAVAAETEEAAASALELIEVEYEELPGVFDALTAAQPGAPVLHPNLEVPTTGMADVISVLDPVPGTNILNRFELLTGDPDTAFAVADLVLEDWFSTPPTQHVPLEPHAAVATWEAGGNLTIWSSTQTPYLVRGELAAIFGLPASEVRVMVPHLGGGFGSKCYSKIEPLVATLARKAGRPVKLVLSREEVFLTTSRHPYQMRMKTGVTLDGQIVAREIEIYIDSGAYADITPRHMRWPGSTGLGPYKIPNARIRTHALYTNKVPTGAFRGYSIPKSAFAGEQQMDQIAHALGMDPAELRRKNLLRDGDTHVTGEVMHHVAFTETLNRALQLAGWAEGATPRTEGDLAYGMGCATTLETTITPSTSAATIKVNEDGSLVVLSSTVEMGQGAHTVLRQIAADEMGVPIDQVRVVFPDTDVTPYDLTTSASRSTFHMGNAVRLAVADAKAQILQLAGPLLEAAAEDLDIVNGFVYRRGDTRAGVPLSTVMRGPGGRFGTITGAGSFNPGGGVDKGGKGQKSSAFFSGATGVAEVVVDLRTGQVKVLRYTSVAHAGSIINPALGRGQSEGSVIMGVSQALLEESLYQDGQPLNASLLDYHIPSILDVPEVIETDKVQLPHPDGPFGAKGLGETDMPPTAAAVANAIARATGIRIHDLPITPIKVMAALKAAKDRSGS